MTYSSIWSDGWRMRIANRARGLGFDSLSALLFAHPEMSLDELAEFIGGEVVVSQIQMLFMEESVKRGDARFAFQDLMARRLRTVLRDGWRNPLDESLRFRIASQLSLTAADLDPYLDRDAMAEAGKAFLAATRPAGWKPTGPHDPAMVELANRSLRSEFKSRR